MELSGNLVMMENNISSDLQCSLWKNSFSLFRFFISMSIGHYLPNFLCELWKIFNVSIIYSIGGYEENSNGFSRIQLI